MGQVVVDQIQMIRQVTMNAVKGLSQEQLDFIPEGFNNNIRWNLGHIYVVQEMFAFRLAGERMNMPENFEALFARGTKPADWTVEPPALEVLLELLAEQPERIKTAFHGRLEEPLAQPFTTGSGVNLTTVGAAINFTAYHEGLHTNTINMLKRFGASSL